MTKRLVFRADGNSGIGLGHMYRLFSLIEMLKETFHITFATRKDSTLSIIDSAYNIQLIPEEISILEEPHWLANKFTSENCIVVADGYQFISSYQRKIKENGFKLVYIDDLVKEHIYADLVVNHSPGISTTDYKKEKYTKFALGTNFSLLRPKFLEIARKRRSISKIEHIFVCFGGADFLDLTFKATSALLKFKNIKRIHVVIGAAYKHQAIDELKQLHPNILILHSNLNEIELLKIMQHSDLGIVPSSTICYELCCVKMPIISGYFIDNQMLIYKGFLKENVIYDGGDFSEYTIDKFKEKIGEVYNYPLERHNDLMNNQFSLFDGMQKERFLSLIKSL